MNWPLIALIAWILLWIAIACGSVPSGPADGIGDLSDLPVDHPDYREAGP